MEILLSIRLPKLGGISSSIKGEMMKINLDISAEMVGIPRKTLEDYFLLFRLGKSLEFNFKTSRKERMGVLRSYVRERSKIKNTNNNK